MSVSTLLPHRLAGVPFLDASGEISAGRIVWVNSGSGSADADGRYRTPVATITQALTKCVASRGDVIYCMPGHAETISAAGGLTVNVAGVSIIGLGNGTNRATLSYSATTSTSIVSAADVTLSNIRFVSAINNLAVFLTVSANHCTVEDCNFITSSALEAYNFIGLTTTYDYLTVKRCRFIQPSDPEGTSSAAGTGAIYLVDSEYVTVEDCQFVGNFETAIIHNKTTLAGQLWVKNCYGYNALSNGKIYVLVANATGGDVNSLWINPNATDMTTAQAFGTESVKFFTSSWFGNDSVTGGQGAQPITAAT